MFQIAKLENVDNESIDIYLIKREQNKYVNGKNIKEIFKTLSFNITGTNYSFKFDLNCKLEKLLEVPLNETTNFTNYISVGDTLLNNMIDPEINATITRYLENKFIVFLTFYTTYNKDNYSGIIEFDFDLNNYL